VDELANWLINQGKSVTTYMVLPDFGPHPFFLANYRYLFNERVLFDDKTVKYEKGELEKQYVKEMIPSTQCVQNVASEIMFLIGHGARRKADLKVPQPSYLVFSDQHSVSVDGQVLIGNSPASARIWSCNKFTEGSAALGREVVYTKWPGGVTLAEVVCRSDLVFVLACNAAAIVEEYAAEEDDQRKKPDFVLFSRSVPTHDISFHIFLALLMTAAEKRQSSGRRLFWDEVVRVLVCQVILWVLEHGNDADQFWQWLKAYGIVLPGQENRTTEGFRIKGSLNTYALTFDTKLKKSDKLILMEELRSLTLAIWDDDDKSYDYIDLGRGKELLEDIKNGEVDFTTYERAKAHASAMSGDMPMHALLEQLRGLYGHAGGAGI
jgi:hypothetical protein